MQPFHERADVPARFSSRESMQLEEKDSNYSLYPAPFPHRTSEPQKVLSVYRLYGI
jgi:hypothetical protein